MRFPIHDSDTDYTGKLVHQWQAENNKPIAR